MTRNYRKGSWDRRRKLEEWKRLRRQLRGLVKRAKAKKED